MSSLRSGCFQHWHYQPKNNISVPMVQGVKELIFGVPCQAKAGVEPNIASVCLTITITIANASGQSDQQTVTSGDRSEQFLNKQREGVTQMETSIMKPIENVKCVLESEGDEHLYGGHYYMYTKQRSYRGVCK